MSELYTCITCRVAFRDGEGQKNHYKSDWHRYNLKRKIAELVPVSVEEFAKRVLAQKTELQENENQTRNCKVCHKHFNTQNSYNNHLNSKKHGENLSKAITDGEPQEDNKLKNAVGNALTGTVDVEDDSSSAETEELDSDEWEEDFNNCEDKYKYCLFCNHRSRSLVRNLRHMTQTHAFFIPDVEYCVHIQGLITYLQAKVHEGFMCLWCNEKGRAFRSAEAAQDHMRDKGHCKMLHEGETLAEYYDFYDYSSSYPADMLENNDDVEPESLDGTGFEMVLPSGSVLGHRSLVKYYKQRLPLANGYQVRTLQRVVKHYKAVGWTGAPSEETTRRARDMHKATRTFAQRSLKLGLQANKLQHHFRPQVNF